MHSAHLAATVSPWVVPNDYGYVLIVAVLIGLSILLIGFLAPGRGKIFTEDFMK